jgi:hypothetical protein
LSGYERRNVDNCTGPIEPARRPINFEAIKPADACAAAVLQAPTHIRRGIGAVLQQRPLPANSRSLASTSSMPDDECNRAHCNGFWCSSSGPAGIGHALQSQQLIDPEPGVSRYSRIMPSRDCAVEGFPLRACPPRLENAASQATGARSHADRVTSGPPASFFRSETPRRRDALRPRSC